MHKSPILIASMSLIDHKESLEEDLEEITEEKYVREKKETEKMS